MTRLLVTVATIALAACSKQPEVAQRNNLLAVGSSTVFPFTKAVFDALQKRDAQMPAPKAEATGTGPGIAAFCAGIGPKTPDIVNASRPMRPDEFAACRSHGVTQIVELPIGLDGIVFVQSPGAPPLKLTRKQLYQALAARPFGAAKPFSRWNEISPSLPDFPIQIYGPPKGDGTRDSLVELVMQPGCEDDPKMSAQKHDPQAMMVCTAIREDAAYKATGEDDQATTTAMIANPGLLGIFGYSYLATKGDMLRGVPVDGVEPTGETIASGRYPASRPLFVYVKKDHVERFPALKAFMTEYAGAIGPGGYLAQKGLVPGTEEARKKVADAAGSMTAFTPAVEGAAP